MTESKIKRGTDLKIFLHPGEFARADDAGYIIRESDGTFTLLCPMLPKAQVIPYATIPLK